MEHLSLEERAAASAVAALGGGGIAAGMKRSNIANNNGSAMMMGLDSPDAAGGGGVRRNKIARTDDHNGVVVNANNEAASVAAATNAATAYALATSANSTAASPEASGGNESKPVAATASTTKPKAYPFFYYEDFSTQADPDSLTPLTPPGRVPNFPAKMHSILSRPDLVDVVCWMPHGRSWRVLKPREFEIRVIPTYFEHAKFSSFIRQANGWGFRRITQGRDRNSYYHPQFLRGLPHLCKDMKRPGVAEKQAADPEHEPDFYKISEQYPVPEKFEDDSILLQCTLQGGPRARMPIYSGALRSSSIATTTMAAATGTKATAVLSTEQLAKTTTTIVGLTPTVPSTTVPVTDAKMPAVASTAAATAAATNSTVASGSSSSTLTPRDREALAAFQQSLGASEVQFKNGTGAAASSTTITTTNNDSATSTATHATQQPSFATSITPSTAPASVISPQFAAAAGGNGNVGGAGLSALFGTTMATSPSAPGSAPTSWMPTAPSMNVMPTTTTNSAGSFTPSIMAPLASLAAPPVSFAMPQSKLSTLAAANQLAFAAASAPTNNMAAAMSAGFAASAASAQFAAGFAAAAALSQHQQLRTTTAALFGSNGIGGQQQRFQLGL